MHLHSETAAPMGSIIGSGGSVITKAVAAENYHLTPKTATPTELAAAIVAARFRLSPRMARVVCELAQIGGRLA